MRLADVMNAPWAITPSMLHEIRDIYETHLRGEKIDIEGVEARLGQQLNNERENYQVIDNVAIINVHGVIAKRMNMFTRISGGVSTQLLEQDIREAREDTEVAATILDIDSGGGTVDGTFELADVIYDMRGEKPIIALASGLAASAAYAIGCAADKFYISGDTTTVGSIGVVSMHRDYSGSEEKQGIKTTEIYAGKYKRIASDYSPLTQEGRENIQETVDYLYSIFVGRVAKFRGVPVSTVLDDMADARLFIGQQGIDAGLVDGVSTLDNLIAELSQGRMPDHTASVSGETQLDYEIIHDITKEPKMADKNEITKGFVAENHPEIADAFRAEGAVTASAEGATAERQRIQDVFAQSMPGHDALIQDLAFDGKTTGPEAAVAVLNAERENNHKLVSGLAADAVEVSAVAGSVGGDDAIVDGENTGAPIEDRCKTKWDKSKKLRAEFGNDFDCYLAYQTANENGQVRIIGSQK